MEGSKRTADGGKKFSLAIGSRKKEVPAKAQNVRTAALHDSDNEDAAQEPQEVSHFDQSAGGAIDLGRQREQEGPLVIQRQKNRDWREERKRKRQHGPLPTNQHQTSSNGVTTNGSSGITAETTSFGLTVVQKSAQEKTAAIEDNREPAGKPPEPSKPKTDDERALEALLGDKPKSTLSIPGVQNEEEVFRRDYDDAPDAPTLEQYNAVPVEEFGAALLRGMGWKDGQAIGKNRGQQSTKLRIPDRRPALLGIGAKEDKAITEEPGAWGKAAKGKRKVEQMYTPVLLRNKATGEQLTEEELKARLDAQQAQQAKNRLLPAGDSDHQSSDKVSKKRRIEDVDRRDSVREKPARDNRYSDSKSASMRERPKYSDSSDSERKDQERRRREKKERERDRDEARHTSRKNRRDRSASVDGGRTRYNHDSEDRRDRDKERRRRDGRGREDDYKSRRSRYSDDSGRDRKDRDRRERDSSRRRHRDR